MVFALHFYAFLLRVDRIAGRILAALPLVLAVVIIFLGYRFVSLPVTLYST